MKRLLLVALVLMLTLLCIISCANNGEGSETGDTTGATVESTADTSADTSADTEEGTDTERSWADVDELSISDYYIVIPNKCPTEITNVAKKLSTGIRTTSGKSVTYMSDVLIGESGPVILLGDTKHPESAETKKLLTDEYSFAIKVFDGNRIAI